MSFAGSVTTSPQPAKANEFCTPQLSRNLSRVATEQRLISDPLLRKAGGDADPVRGGRNDGDMMEPVEMMKIDLEVAAN